MTALAKAFGFFREYLHPERLAPLPVPPNHYLPSQAFTNSVLVTLSDGSVSMGLGKMVTAEDHEARFNSLRNYFCMDQQA